MTGSINTLLDNRPQPQPTPTREGLFEIFSPIRSSCVYICVPSENTRLGVYVSSQYQYLSATFFFNQQQIQGLGGGRGSPPISDHCVLFHKVESITY